MTLKNMLIKRMNVLDGFHDRVIWMAREKGRKKGKRSICSKKKIFFMKDF